MSPRRAPHRPCRDASRARRGERFRLRRHPLSPSWTRSTAVSSGSARGAPGGRHHLAVRRKRLLDGLRTMPCCTAASTGPAAERRYPPLLGLNPRRGSTAGSASARRRQRPGHPRSASSPDRICAPPGRRPARAPFGGTRLSSSQAVNSSTLFADGLPDRLSRVHSMG
jgi:hypothetical protein